jgi:CDP-4-dehydro-6-deoxyglucose reductase
MEGPFGSFFLREDSDKPIILLASGTGFAPIKALIEQMQAKAAHARRCCTGAAAARPTSTATTGALQQAAAMPGLRYVPVLSEPAPEDAWTGRTGFVHEAVMADWPDLSGHQVYACGAPVMVDAAQRDFTSPLRPAGRRVLRRLLHLRSRQARHETNA